MLSLPTCSTLPNSSPLLISPLCCPDLVLSINSHYRGEMPLESHYHREKRQPWSWNIHENEQAVQNFSQRCKTMKLGISCLEAKPNLKFEDEKGPNASEKISQRLPSRALGPLWSQSGASWKSPAAAMMVSVFPMFCYIILPASSHGASHSCRSKGTQTGDRSSQQAQGNCCITMSWPKQRLFGRMKLLMSWTEVKYNR